MNARLPFGPNVTRALTRRPQAVYRRPSLVAALVDLAALVAVLGIYGMAAALVCVGGGQ